MGQSHEHQLKPPRAGTTGNTLSPVMGDCGFCSVGVIFLPQNFLRNAESTRKSINPEPG